MGTPGVGGMANMSVTPLTFEMAQRAGLILPAVRPTAAPLLTLRVGVADAALVMVGDRVEPGQPLLERSMEVVLVEVAARGGLESLAPGAKVDAALLPAAAGMGRHHPRSDDRVRMLFVDADGVARLAVGRSPQVLLSPVWGIVETAAAGHLTIRAEGIGLAAAVGWGEPVHGRLLMGVASPDAELRASSIDIGAAGSILVAGARLDIEALTRARAIGVAGVICGGVVGRELRQLAESDTRQRASLHTTSPFAVLTLDGYGRRPLPQLAWDLLSSAAGREVGLLPEAHIAVVSGDAAADMPPPRARDEVRITAGDGAGRVGRLVGLAGPVRRPGGGYQVAGYVDDPAAPDGQPRRRVVPLADLERLG